MESISCRFWQIGIILLILGSSVYGHEFEGIWKSGQYDDLSSSSYLSIMWVEENVFYVLYINPFRDNNDDFVAYGKINEEGVLEVENMSNCLYLEYDGGQIYSYWNSFHPFPDEYFKIQPPGLDNYGRTEEEKRQADLQAVREHLQQQMKEQNNESENME